MAETKTTKTYKLYAGKVQEVPENIRFSFVPSHLKYLLIFTDETPDSKKFIEVTPELEKSLTDEEKAWLSNSSMTVNLEAMRANEGGYSEFFEKFIKTFSAELKREAEKQKKETASNNNKTVQTKG